GGAARGCGRGVPPGTDRRPDRERARGAGSDRAMSRGYLLVRVDGKAYGLPLARVVEVGDLGDVLDVPRALPAMRGLTPLRGRLVPLVHLGALMGERPAPAGRGRAAVLVEIGAGEGIRHVAFEVDDADDVVREAALPVPQGESLRWASAVARRRGVLVPILDPEVLQLAATEVTAPPGLVKGLAADYITGLVVKNGRTIIVLNTSRLLSSQEKLALETAVQEKAQA